MNTFAPGPPIAPAAPLLNWLNNEIQPGRRRVRLPVVVHADQLGLGTGAAFIGVDASPPDAETVPLALETMSLPMPLFEVLRSRQPGVAAPWVVWLEGAWTTMLSGPAEMFGRPEGTYPFVVLDVGDPITTPLRREETHAFGQTG